VLEGLARETREMTEKLEAEKWGQKDGSKKIRTEGNELPQKGAKDTRILNR